jgi:hypothetical protein
MIYLDGFRKEYEKFWENLAHKYNINTNTHAFNINYVTGEIQVQELNPMGFLVSNDMDCGMDTDTDPGIVMDIDIGDRIQ